MDRTDLPAGRDEESLDIPLHPFVSREDSDSTIRYLVVKPMIAQPFGAEVTGMNVEALKRAAGI